MRVSQGHAFTIAVFIHPVTRLACSYTGIHHIHLAASRQSTYLHQIPFYAVDSLPELIDLLNRHQDVHAVLPPQVITAVEAWIK